MNKQKINEKRITRITVSFLFLAIAAVLVLTLSRMQPSAEPVYDDLPTTITINSDSDLLTYATEYAAGRHNPEDTLNLSKDTGSFYDLTSSGFPGIGTSTRPFKGTIEIPGTAVNEFHADRALFNCITTDVRVIDPSDGTSREISFVRAASDTDSPLFAAEVRASEENPAPTASWIISVESDDTGTDETAYSFAGVIGTIDNNCKVRVEFTHNSTFEVQSDRVTANVSSEGNVGVICGNLGENCELTFKINAPQSFDVVSKKGHAGGVVGVVGDGSKIIVADDSNDASDDFTLTCNVKASNNEKYAGGICGEATNAELLFEGNSAPTVSLSKTIEGHTGAGGVYGHYICTEGNGTGADADIRTFELKEIKSDGLTVKGPSGSCSAGGFIGYLESDKSITVTETGANLTDSTFARSVSLGSGNNCGGIIGFYSNSVPSNTLHITNAEVRITSCSGTATGGILGRIHDQAAYVKIDDIYVNNTGSQNVGGGVVGSMGNVGSFVDLTGTAKIKGKFEGGLVKWQNDGIVRLSGTSDLSESTCSVAQLISERKNGLVYALGSGSDSGWKFKRGSSRVDDIGDWGEVLRLSSENGLSESTFFTVNESAHTVSVAGHVANMGSLADFVKTALNIQLNTETSTSRGYLSFSASSKSAVILNSNLSLTNDIDLRKTGIISLTRDNGENNAFTKTLNGNNHSLTLATGEAYGMVNETSLTYLNSWDNMPSSDNSVKGNNYGTIMGHKYLGLFAKAENATIENLTLSSDGFISVRPNVNGTTNTRSKYYIGGLVAEAYTTSGNTFTIDNISTNQKMNICYNATNSDLHCGGGVGAFKDGSAGTFEIKNSIFKNQISEKRISGSYNSFIGGVVGYDASKAAHTTKFTAIELEGTYDNTVESSQFGGVHYGGLLSYVAASNGDISRKIELKNITVGNEVDIKTKVSGGERATGAGAFLGSEWLDVDVTMGTSSFNDGVTIGTSAAGTPSITVPSGSTNVGIGALVYKATGHMLVNHVEVVKANVNSAVNSSFGFIVNDALNGNSSALYLDVVGKNYNIANLSFTNSGTSVFDEIAAYSVVNGKSIEENGQAIVSIRTGNDNPVIMNGASCNTYQNQTSYGKNTVKTNSNTRYYYNLDLIRGKSNASAAEKLLLWSLNKYAHSTVRGNYFNQSYGNTISGNCDMEGLSYYPVDFSGTVNISLGTKIKFYNDEIENGESGTGDTDGVARSTRATSPKTQHYMMHEGIFRNFSGSLTVNGLTLEGNVSNQHGGNNSGFLICGMLGDQNERTTANINNVVLSGAEIDRVGNEYGPLLINRIGKNVQFTLTGVEQENYPATGTVAVASSLIGDVGYDTAENINLTFSNITLDSRTSNSPALSSHPYGTDRAIFNRATLLNSFKYLRGSLAVYNYTYDEDWPSAHRVTYGKEVKDSVEYAGKENKYYSDIHYTDPTDANAASEYNFSSGFLPYVYNGGNTYDPSTNKYHEIKVNVKDEGLVSGCGQYNDPYNIESGDALVTAAKIIRGDLVEGMTVRLPSDLGKNNNLMWHDADLGEDDLNYVYKTVNNVTKFYCVNDNTISKDTVAVREYLAGAYYNILSNIEIEASSNYPGLGSVANWTANSYDCKFAFRGVIVGNGNTITNKTSEPLIKSSNGCVVKDLTVAVEANVSIIQDSVKQFNYADESCNTYGAVIGKVMGGDTIIDNVSVDLADLTITVNASANVNHRLMPVGGYIGVIVSGGVIFRNMDIVAQKTGITASVCSVVTDAGYLYVNPIIGRVISGYAFNESSTYAASSNIVVNRIVINDVSTVKNYDICDLNPDNTNKLTVSGSSGDSMSIAVPDSQALYVLSCIVNSGAGSAPYKSTDLDNFAIVSGPWNAYRTNTSVKNAHYSEVGTSAVLGGDYSSTAEDIKYDATNKAPYIVATYTNKSGNVYHARSICGNGDNAAVNTITFSNTTYNLGAGYRGIGHLFSDDNAFKLRFNKITGSNAIISLNMVYQEYNHKSGSQDHPNDNYIENYIPLNNSGFGLFNVIYQMDASSNTIKNLTLSGSVFYDIRKISDGSKIKYAYEWHNYNSTTGFYPDVADRVEFSTILHVGGLAGSCGTDVYAENITISSLNVEGAKYAGGMIGCVSGKNVTLDYPSATSIRVIGGMFAGGLVGGVEKEVIKINGKDVTTEASLNIRGSEKNVSVINLDTITVKGAPSCAKLHDSSFQGMFHSAGGLCGSVQTKKQLLIENIKVTGGLITAENRNYLGTKLSNGSTIYNANDLRYKTMTGGLVGRLKDTKATVNNTTIDGVDILGDVSGGFFGYSTDSLDLEMKNNSLAGASGKSSIDGINEAGGVFGGIWGNANNLKIIIQGLSIDNWNIISTASDATRPAAGGFFGLCYITNTVSGFSISNAAISNCDLRISSDVDKDGKYGGVGGVFGYLGQNSNALLRGKNLMINNITTTRPAKAKNYFEGMIGGKNNSAIIKLVGVSIQNGDAISKEPIGSPTSGNIYGGSGYVVMADYFGVSIDNSQNTTDSTLFNSSTNPTDYSATSPYVTVNPGTNVGTSGLFLTSDGVSSTVAGLPIQKIVDGDIRYGVGRANFATLYNNGNNSYISKLSTFNAEQNTNLANDFAVLIVDNVSRVKTTEMINAYINLLANTNMILNAGKGGYGQDSDNVYKVKIYKMVYDSSQGKFVKSTDPANLKRDTSVGQFYMEMDSVDTAGTMFSLIDVQYLDPYNKNKVAYHLYIPVLVKKMLTFDFDIAAESATNYCRSDYVSRWGLPVMENIGTPTTAFFRYTYLRTIEEWQAAINNGESLLRNYDKKLMLDKVGTFGNEKLPDDTIVVLVDPNRGGKPYYARLSDVYNSSTEILSLSGFREELDNSSSAAFTPVTLNSLLNLTPTLDASGLFVNCSEETDATVTIGEYHYRLAEDNAEDNAKDHYSITVNGTNELHTVKKSSGETYTVSTLKLEEQYYISFLTEADSSNVLYHYTLSTPNSFGDNANPSRIVDLSKIQQGDGIVHLILGNIFVQTNSSVTTPNNNQEMSALDNNNTLAVTMTSQVKVLEDIYNEVAGYISGNNISIYHSFIMNMTRTDASGTSKNIVVDVSDANKSATYTITSSGSVSAYNNQNAPLAMNGSYAEVSPGYAIDNYIVAGEGSTATITSVITLVYENDVIIGEQFPNREDESQMSIGTIVSGKSNIAYDPQRTSYSKSSALLSDTAGHSYYSHVDDRRAKLTYNVTRDVYGGDYGHLGINPLDSNDLTEITVPTLAVYDISSIVEKAAAYDSVRIHITLSRKTDNYSAKLDFPTYMYNIWHEGYDADPLAANHLLDSTDTTNFRLTESGGEYKEYVYTFSKAALEDNSALSTSLEIPIEYMVYTGAVFEERNLMYSNYKLTLSVELVKSSTGDVLAVSMADDYIIYTNARVYPDYLNPQ